ncbi:MAG: type II toxin-antitoxin system RelE/ParE family toxin [Planctomycetes bacterium]|nr:type II toxin-antitoxin system RelE/ParE family toxin [Planctomycetota bacterium]
MTRYTVNWKLGAQNHLAQLWIEAPDRDVVTAAANQIDNELAEDPDTKGRPLREGLRSLDISPLRVLYEVNEMDRIVHVYSVRRIAPPSPPQLGNGEPPPTG